MRRQSKTCGTRSVTPRRGDAPSTLSDATPTVRRWRRSPFHSWMMRPVSPAPTIKATRSRSVSVLKAANCSETTASWFLSVLKRRQPRQSQGIVDGSRLYSRAMRATVRSTHCCMLSDDGCPVMQSRDAHSARLASHARQCALQNQVRTKKPVSKNLRRQLAWPRMVRHESSYVQPIDRP